MVHEDSLLKRIESILSKPTKRRQLLAQEGELAQSLLDLLQAVSIVFNNYVHEPITGIVL
jgi:hypothetical protein